MNLTIRTLIFALLGLTTLVCCRFFSDAETNPEAGIVVWLPDDLVGYEIRGGVMSKEEKEWLPKDTTFLKREYTPDWMGPERALENRVSATLIVAGSDSRSLHRPQVCLRAQNWTIAKREVVEIATAGGPLQVMDFHLVQALRNEDGSTRFGPDGEPLQMKAHYVYWWIGPDASTPSDEERVWLEVWNSILKGRRERWAYPSVMSWVGSDGKRAPAQERAYEFIARYAPHFQKSLGAVDREDAVPLKAIAE
ncbi:exosortase-associated EpsI family protein [Roseibacillus ishigakijimensis]|uniref:Exosortase-associated EpsI family protein n=1 Tax=Roseibacillus ishigakijimensis TaxID=454146 RepID=A0A934RSI5_9BACT|nr:exosortase-associated EpsI family protein [Roseibacillus ishigakijimensis]MBK1833430.1 exosortase-associated EpsI family protein [Roseibacillus ishigakijimensis]